MKWPHFSLTWGSKIVILTGAGISAESGLKTFRDHNGLWENHDVMEVANPEGFKANPELVYRFYNERRQGLFDGSVAPNSAHLALARLEREWRGEVVVITQNVDDLHERAGTKNLIHMHGELLKMRCQKSGELFKSPPKLTGTDSCTCCGEAGTLRPHIVWFGEIPLQMESIHEHLLTSELFVAIGTSGLVYPAASMVNWAQEAGACTIEINLESSERATHFDHTFQGLASKLVPTFVDELLRQSNLPSL